MKITICGSMHHINNILRAKAELMALGYEAETPDQSENNNYTKLPEVERFKKKEGLIRAHLQKISSSDAIFVFNQDKNGIPGYIGGNTLMEMAFAFAQGIEIFLFQHAHNLSIADEVYGMQPIVLAGKVSAIDAYFKSLPKTFVSSKSPIKLCAVSRGLRRAGIRTLVLSRPTKSSVTEQPQTIEETYQGARNRHHALQRETAAEEPAFLATIESGHHAIHPRHNVFSAGVVVLQKIGHEEKTGITLEVEMPKAMTDKVPSIYPDIGVLVQQEYGSTLKDPFPFFTNGKLDRLQLLENSVFTVAAQLVTSSP